MTKINEIWAELENDTSISSGLLLRRYAANVLPDVYVALRQPQKLRCIAFRIDSNIQISVNSYGNLRDINIELFADENDNARQYLLISLANTQYQDVFSILCEDLIFAISNVTDE